MEPPADGSDGAALLTRSNRPLPPPPALQRLQFMGVRWKMVTGMVPAQHRSLLKLKRRGCRVQRSVVLATIAARLADRPPHRRYPCMLSWTIPSALNFLWSIADNVGAYNSELGGKLAPLMERTVLQITAVVRIQSAFRAYRCRKLLSPPLVVRVIERRASLCVQRGFRMHIMLRRIAMLTYLKRYLAALPHTDTLCISKAAYARFEDVIEGTKAREPSGRGRERRRRVRRAEPPPRFSPPAFPPVSQRLATLLLLSLPALTDHPPLALHFPQ